MKVFIIPVNFIFVTLVLVPLYLVTCILAFLGEVLNLFTIKGYPLNGFKNKYINNNVLGVYYSEITGMLSSLWKNIKDIKELY